MSHRIGVCVRVTQMTCRVRCGEGKRAGEREGGSRLLYVAGMCRREAIGEVEAGERL